jgi:signal transduction histidine kinase
MHDSPEVGSGGLYEPLKDFFFGAWYMPHGHCYLWKPGLVWLHVISDLLIGGAYVLISLVLYALVRRIRLPFSTVIIAFGLFIGACGLTHFMEVWNVWNSAYWLAGWVKALTAAASVLTGVFLVQLRPKVVEVASAARLAEERRTQLESKNHELEALYARLKAAEELRTQFFANVSHELRTPLSLILGPVERMLGEEGLTEAQRRGLETVARNGRLLLKQVNDLLDASRLEAGKMETRYSEADLAGLVRVTSAFFASAALERQLTHTVEAPERLPAQVDTEKLQRVLINLLSNAFKFVPAGGQVRTSLREEAGHAVLSVEDTGPGVKPEQRGLIFERFRQGDGGATRTVGGTGLGLAIVKDFVELHRGTVTVDEAPGGGARFTVTLPLRAPLGVQVHSGPGEADTAMATVTLRNSLEELRTPAVAPVAGTGAHAHVALVVEDNPEMRQFITETLAPGFQVQTAANGREGLEKARALRPDVLITDMMMPVMSGDQLVRAVREEESLALVPILLLTAKADDALRVQLLREGAQDYLTKPFLAEELQVRARNLASAKKAREVLQRELASQAGNLVTLVEEVALRKRQLQAALEATRMALQQAEQASMAKSTFLQLVSHELRTPLTAIQLQLQSMSRQAGAEAPAARAFKSFRRLVHIVESILEYTSIESGRLATRPESFDVEALAREVVEDLLSQAQQKLLRLEVGPRPPDLPPLLSDSRLVRLVLINLVMNAVKYTERGSIEVWVEHGPEGHRLAVRDTGRGIPPEQLARIFEPFEQLEPMAHKHTPGVGLGLTLVKELVGALGGRVEVQSVVGQGSTFSVVLPPLQAQEAPGVPAQDTMKLP